MRGFRLLILILAVTAVPACGRRVATIDISPKKVRIYGANRTQRLTARLLDKKGQPIEQGSATWSSSRSDVASIEPGGLVTAKSEGKTMITATFEKVSAQLPVEVIDVKTMDIEPVALKLIGPAGTRFPLVVASKNSKGNPVNMPVVWTSSKATVATVDSAGVVTSVAPGVATIIAKLGDLQAGSDVAVILHDLTRLEMRPATAIVRVGDTQNFEVVGFGADGQAIEGLSTIFQSSDPAVARVDPSGRATGVAAGTASIRATLGAVSAEATLLVN